MQFKSERIALEYQTLQQKNEKLWRLISLADQFSKLELGGKEITLTMIYRTQAEHDELYKDTPASQKPKVSPHQLWQAVDIRSSIYSAREIERLLAFLNNFTYQGGQRKVSSYHMVAGNTYHFHVQYGDSK